MRVNSTCFVGGIVCAHCSRTENCPNEYMSICERVSAQMRSTYIKCNGTHFFTLRVYTFPLNCDTPQLNARIPKDPKQKRNKLDEEKKGEFSDLFSLFLLCRFRFIRFHFIPFHFNKSIIWNLENWSRKNTESRHRNWNLFIFLSFTFGIICFQSSIFGQ